MVVGSFLNRRRGGGSPVMIRVSSPSYLLCTLLLLAFF
jgi:hypothetical protein